MDAIECYRQAAGELGQELEAEQARCNLREWSCMQSRRHLHERSLSDFKSRCCEKLGDIAIDARQLDEAISQYSTALTLNPTTPQALLAQQRKTCAVPGMRGNALNEANEVCHFLVSKCVVVDSNRQVLMPDSSSPFDYERVSMKWAKVVLTKGSWENALTSASEVCGSSTDVCRKTDSFIRSSRSLDLLCTRRYVNVSKR